MKENIEKMIETHKNCVHWTIHKLIGSNETVYGLEYDDLFQEGCIALWRAAETYDTRKGTQFHSYAISVIHNHLVDYCRKIQCRAAPTEPLDERTAEFWDDTSDLYVQQVLEYGKRSYQGVAKLGVEALELKIAGYSGTDIAALYGVQPNHVGAWISRAAQKLKKDVLLVENNGENP